METNYILATISFILAHFTSFMFGYKCADIENKKLMKQVLLFGTLTYILVWAFTTLSTANKYRDGQIDALKGKFKYRMEINYDQHGIPKDTIYVKL